MTVRVTTRSAALVLLFSGHLALAGQKSVREIIRATGITGGLLVHVNCGAGQLAAEFAQTGGFLVHGLDADPRNVVEARKFLQGLGLYGKASIDHLEGAHLPYKDGVVNLLISQSPEPVIRAEIKRVLAPGGVAYVREGKQWARTVQPRPKELDEWTHFLHGPNGNAVSRDAAVGPPRHMQWQVGPAWLRNHHKLASISSLVSAGERIFYVADEAPSASLSLPARWFLEARNAFSGVLLWRKTIQKWGNYKIRFRSGPVQLPRLLVADRNNVYLPLGIDTPLSVLDASDGKTVFTCQGTEHAEEVVLSQGVLFAVTGTGASEQAMASARKKGTPLPQNRKSVVAVEADSGKLLWKYAPAEGAPIMPLTLAASAYGVFLQSGSRLVCLDRQNGRERWASPLKIPAARKGKRNGPGWSTATLVVSDEVVLLANGGKLHALSEENGKTLWVTPCKNGFRSPADVLVIRGLVWTGSDFVAGRDLRTGEIRKRNIPARNLWTAGHHHRCYRDKATERYLLTGKRGIEFFDLDADNHSRNNWIRGLCQYGVMPANGLIYAPSHACGCFMEAKLHGFWALAPGSPTEQPLPEAHPLEKGPAFSQVPPGPGDVEIDWPTYRQNPLRSGVTKSPLPTSFEAVWQSHLEGRLSAPVAAGGTVYVAQVDTHQLYALDAKSGRQLWSFTAGGRIDSPPTIFQGRVLFGAADGWIYCLRSPDGVLAWRLRAAPADLRALSFDQLESLWPVHGSLLVQGHVAYACAGRSSYLDGGIILLGLDPITGRILHRARIHSESPRAEKFSFQPKEEKINQNKTDQKTFTSPDKSDAFAMEGTTSDVLVSDGVSVYLRQFRFGADCKRKASYGRHLFSTSGLLDNAENHRSHWVLGSGDFRRTPVAYSWIVNIAKSRFGKRITAPIGIMLAFDDQNVWVARRYPRYILFCEPNRPFAADEAAPPDFQDTAEIKASPRKWTAALTLRPRALIVASDTLLLGGMSADVTKPESFEGRRNGLLRLVSASSGETISQQELPSPPVWDGMAVARGRLYVTTTDGHVLCLGKK